MKRVIVFILFVCFVVNLPLNVYAADKKESEPTAVSSILMCMDTGDVIREDNAYEHVSPASVTKIMSLLLIMEAIDSGKISLSDMVTTSENAQSKGGSQIWLETGEQMSVEDLLKAVVIASANDACTALGEYIAGSDSAFVKMMNDKVEELGLKDTNFENCTGLDDTTVNHYSCAYDLAVIATEVMKYDLIKKYSTVWLDSLRNGETELNNTNKLVNTYDGITGLKTGTTSNAGFCLCATATRDGMSLVSVVLGAETSQERFDLASQLLDFGFNNYKLCPIEIDSSKITEVKVKNGRLKKTVPVSANYESILVTKDCENFEYEYNIKNSVSAPVRKGDPLGEIVVMSANSQVASVELVASEDIKKVNFSYIFSELIKNI